MCGRDGEPDHDEGRRRQLKFNSLEYLLFLPAVFLLHWLLPHRLRWALLLAASWAFYFWWDFRAGLLLAGVTLVSWLCAKGMSCSRSASGRTTYFGLALAATLGCLCFFKYSAFFASLAGLELALRVLLPVGISFYAFQTLSYVIDVYRGKISPERHFGYFALFISFFPQLVAGPIERADSLLPQLRAERCLRREDLRAGGWLLLSGYFKKIVIADRLAPFVDRIYSAPSAALGPEIILATVLFGIQIYCDFSGYSDIARGSARLLGIDLMENFRRPYEATGIRDFWRRWHISLTAWFTEYIYIPLGGSRKGLPRQIVNLSVVFLLSGLWHGAGWTFILWGLLHALYQILELLLVDRKSEEAPSGLRAALRCACTFSLVTFAWLFFRAASLNDVPVLLSRLFASWHTALSALRQVLPAAALPVICLPFVDRLSEADPRRSIPASAFTALCMVIAIAAAWLIQLSGGGQNAFIYFQF